jgi:hypothetical protein
MTRKIFILLVPLVESEQVNSQTRLLDRFENISELNMGFMV